MSRFLRTLQSADSLLLTAVVLTAVFGMVGLMSLSFRTDPPDFSGVERQLVALGLAAVIGFTIARVDWRAWERWWIIIAIMTSVALVGVLVFGVRIRGTRGWFAFGGWTLQPVEFAKIALILLQAVYFRRRVRALHRIRTIVESAAITGALVVPVLLQPDLGSAALLGVTWIGMLLVFGLRRRYVLSLVMVALVGMVMSWLFLLKPYQHDRILTVLDPNRDPQGAGYNQRQALVAVGAGGILGRGFGQGTQSQLRFLPEAQSDFLPAVLAEEFGLVGVTMLLVCLAVILLRLLRIAERCPDDCSAAFIVGFGILFGFQSLFNLAMNFGIAPVMGIPFPLVSAGGSAVLAFALGFGMVASIARQIPRAAPAAYELNVIE